MIIENHCDKEETRPPKKAMRRAVRNKLINKAIKEGTFLDLDAIYKDGKLFGCNYYIIPGSYEKNVNLKQINTIFYCGEDDIFYTFLFEFDLLNNMFVLSYKTKDKDGIPFNIQMAISLHTLNHLKVTPELVFKETAEKMIKEIKKLKN